MMSKTTAKAVKVSKNRKKSWKKHCPVDDVEEYLDNKRFNERIGGSAADKSDESLFVIEKTANNALLSEDKQKATKAPKESKLKSIQSDIKYFKLLESQSKVDPISPRIGPKETKRTLLNDDKKFAKLWPQKRKQYLRAKQMAEERKAIKADPKLRYEFGFDLWGEKPETHPDDEEIEELIDYQEVLKGSKPPKVPKHRYNKPSLLPSVEVPLSGQSYNPSSEAHQSLLAMAHDIEVKKIREDQHFTRLVEDHYVTKASAPNDQTWSQEMSHGLGLSDDEDNDIEDQTEENDEKISHQLIRADKKKTKAQRNKELLQKQMSLKKKLEKGLKIKANEIFKLKTYKKELDRKDKESTERQMRRSERIRSKLFKPKRMSRYEYSSPDVELNLTQELSGSLRSMKTEGNLLEDRFKSIQRRNIIETRTKQTFKRKYKLKKIIKKSCKDPIL
ncbi:unnamed protein product [Medioppia subpectinata]|uniref:Ribosome biogenesis protein NOP53 n=1 Tax=Medioppia subpectinata TaxID=1979941 RepID=A0A7R9KCD7_9ACAR|nr:unnamed protein product [Medioppia subpectinata]CAG2100890.1 unnamed protein product [Medioppia subpectinata]